MVKKSEIRKWLKRARLDIRDIETILKRPGPLDDADLDDIREWAMDLSGAGGELADLVGGD